MTIIRKIVVSASLAIILLLTASIFIATNTTVKLFLFIALVIFGSGLVILYLFQTWSDHKALQSEIDQLRRECAVDRALDEARIGRLEASVGRIKEMMYSELAVRSMNLDSSGFSDALNQFLEKAATAEGHDG
jgi:hypothetical protein